MGSTSRPLRVQPTETPQFLDVDAVFRPGGCGLVGDERIETYEGHAQSANFDDNPVLAAGVEGHSVDSCEYLNLHRLAADSDDCVRIQEIAGSCRRRLTIAVGIGQKFIHWVQGGRSRALE
jgi:hypothetical protein